MEFCDWLSRTTVKKLSIKLPVYQALDTQISNNLGEAGIETRIAKSNGLLCCMLIPTILNLYCIICPVSPAYRLTAYVSVGLLAYSILFILFLTMSGAVLTRDVYSGCVASAFITTIIIYTRMDFSLYKSLAFSLLSMFAQCSLLRYLLMSYPKTFTIGEANVVVQGIVLFWVGAITDMTFSPVTVNQTIIYAALISSSLLVWVLNRAEPLYDTWESLLIITGIAGVITLFVLHYICGPMFFLHFLGYIFLDKIRFRIFVLWLTMTLVAVCAIVIRTNLGLAADTSVRKVFHVLASVVFISGTVNDKEFMTLAAGCIMGVLIFVEALRKLNIDPVSTKLQEAFLVYSDSKDSGAFAVTPIYLYVALASPFALVPDKSRDVELLSGVLAIGIGDTAASWFGQRYGITKWIGKDKTLEGTIGNILAQVAVVYFLSSSGLINNVSLGRTFIAATVTGYVEAQTDQIDNLILPLVFIITSQVFSSL